MHIHEEAVAVLTAADGSGTFYSTNVTGIILGIRVVVPGSGGIEATSDLTITKERTGEQILTVANVNGSNSYYPRVITNKAADGTVEAASDYIGLHSDRVKIIIAQGGNAKAATVYVTVG